MFEVGRKYLLTQNRSRRSPQFEKYMCVSNLGRKKEEISACAAYRINGVSFSEQPRLTPVVEKLRSRMRQEEQEGEIAQFPPIG